MSSIIMAVAAAFVCVCVFLVGAISGWVMKPKPAPSGARPWQGGQAPRKPPPPPRQPRSRVWEDELHRQQLKKRDAEIAALTLEVEEVDKVLEIERSQHRKKMQDKAKEVADSEEKAREYEEKWDAIAAEYRIMERKQPRLEKEIERVKERNELLDDFSKNLQRDSRAEIKALKQDKRNLEKTVDELERSQSVPKLKQEIQMLQSSNASLNTALTTSKAKNGKLETEIANLKIGKTNLEKEIESLKTSKTNVDAQITKLKSQAETMQKQTTDLQTNNAALAKEIAGLKKSKTNLEDNINSINSTKAELEKENRSLKSQIRDAQQTSKDLETNKTATKTANEQLQSQNDILTKRVNELVATNNDLDSKIQTFANHQCPEADTTGLQASNRQLQQQLDSLKAEHDDKMKRAKAIVDECNNKIQQLEGQVKEPEKRVKELQNQRKIIMSDLKKSKDAFEKLKTRTDEIVGLNTMLINDNTKLRDENARFRFGTKKPTPQQADYGYVAQQNEELRKQVGELRQAHKKLDDANKELNETMAEVYHNNECLDFAYNALVAWCDFNDLPSIPDPQFVHEWLEHQQRSQQQRSQQAPNGDEFGEAMEQFNGLDEQQQQEVTAGVNTQNGGYGGQTNSSTQDESQIDPSLLQDGAGPSNGPPMAQDQVRYDETGEEIDDEDLYG